jgi:hypothetical protein
VLIQERIIGQGPRSSLKPRCLKKITLARDSMAVGAEQFFKHDVFISYARADNATGIVSALGAQLKEFLAPMLRREPSIWFDDWSLDVKSDIASQIRLGLRDSAVLITIASEKTESRKWCRDEMGWYFKQINFEAIDRWFPAFLPIGDDQQWPRWRENLPIGSEMFLDPSRTELFAEQNLQAHQWYWDRLYGWFARVSDGIVSANANFEIVRIPETETITELEYHSSMQPQLIADITLYGTSAEGRSSPIAGEWFDCRCKLGQKGPEGKDCRLMLNGRSITPGEVRRLGLVFLSPDSAALFQAAGKFYFCESRGFFGDGPIIGEAIVVPS